MDKVYVPYIKTGIGYKYVLTVYEKQISPEFLIFTYEFNAPSMVIANNMFTEWRKNFLELNGFKDDNFIYELYNISLGKRRVIK